MPQDYSALVTKWNTLSGTTQSKIDQVNATVVTGVVPTSITVAADAVFNCITFSEFNALTAQQQSNILGICHVAGQLLGGSANVSKMLAGMLVAYFPPAGSTIANLTAMAKATSSPWCNTPVAQGGGGLASPTINQNDLTAAGGLV